MQLFLLIAILESRCRGVYEIRVKSDMLKVVKTWFSDIADLMQKHKLVVVMQDNAGENK
jgi:hypothetical protein